MSGVIAKDPLHIAALVITSVAAICQVLGSFLPNWWILMDNKHNIIATYNLFGDIHCSDVVCFPYGNDTDGLPAESPNAMWLSTIRVLSVIGIALVFLTLLVQCVFLLVKPIKPVSVTAIAVLMAAALVSFVNGFLFISKYSTLSYVYAMERPPNALIYNSGASALILISFILCIVAAVCTTYGLRLPTRKQFAPL